MDNNKKTACNNASSINPNGMSKMTKRERAKQFMPFAALKGYEEALKKVEEEHENATNSEVKGH